ncbi:MAG: hypothetical protein K6U74_13730 [Firmicutes bacterium]|nr:hypothetical protein [Bacillota bacterium]
MQHSFAILLMKVGMRYHLKKGNLHHDDVKSGHSCENAGMANFFKGHSLFFEMAWILLVLSLAKLSIKKFSLPILRNGSLQAKLCFNQKIEHQHTL